MLDSAHDGETGHVSSLGVMILFGVTWMGGFEMEN